MLLSTIHDRLLKEYKCVQSWDDNIIWAFRPLRSTLLDIHFSLRQRLIEPSSIAARGTGLLPVAATLTLKFLE